VGSLTGAIGSALQPPPWREPRDLHLPGPRRDARRTRFAGCFGEFLLLCLCVWIREEGQGYRAQRSSEAQLAQLCGNAPGKSSVYLSFFFFETQFTSLNCLMSFAQKKNCLMSRIELQK
jgi:hypothetical protein